MIETLEFHRQDRQDLQKDLTDQHQVELTTLETRLTKECNEKMREMHKTLNEKYEEVIIEMNGKKDQTCMQYMNAQKDQLSDQYGR